ncbi:MAG: MarR family transcriptional regulator [Halobacteriovoraceae bacterium]|jgi:DNA-binding MarR family transcriptional regulator|nr:MarR family transcriptional regulator [Halobacteriovoraceae bacterium]
MSRVSEIGSLLKKIYRAYSSDLLSQLEAKGFIDLRPSFLEILTFICENEAVSIKEIGLACGLKKQTMTSHLNELEKRGYIIRKTGEHDRRELKVMLTAYGEKFKFALLEVIGELEKKYQIMIGEVEMDRILMTLTNFQTKINHADQQSMLL